MVCLIEFEILPLVVTSKEWYVLSQRLSIRNAIIKGVPILQIHYLRYKWSTDFICYF